MIQHDIIDYKIFGKCLKISSSKLEVIVTLDVGPRVISFRRLDGKNVFWEDLDDLVYLNNESLDEMFYRGATWHGYGGHRLWASPEAFHTYYPDNKSVSYQIDGNKFTFTQEAQFYNMIQQTISLTFLQEDKIRFEGTITNLCAKPKKLACWSLSMVKGPGLEIIKLPTEETGFYPQRTYALWGFGAPNNDDRAYYGKDFYTLKMIPNRPLAYKVGLKVSNGTAMYVNGEDLFVKSFPYDTDAEYPDIQVNYETYTKDLFLEMETLGPLKTIKKGESLSHFEDWVLYPYEKPIPKQDDETKFQELYQTYAK